MKVRQGLAGDRSGAWYNGPQPTAAAYRTAFTLVTVMLNTELAEKLKAIRLFAMDVDGVLTDGSITWGTDAAGHLIELKSFSARDGLALGMVPSLGMEVAWITGRVSPIVARRAEELSIREVSQWARNKRLALEEISARLGREAHEVLYIGDDLNDLPAFEAAGVRVAVADAAEIVRKRADWVTTAPGGRGAAREVIETVLKVQGRWHEAVTAFLARLEQEHGAPPPRQ